MVQRGHQRRAPRRVFGSVKERSVREGRRRRHVLHDQAMLTSASATRPTEDAAPSPGLVRPRDYRDLRLA